MLGTARADCNVPYKKLKYASPVHEHYKQNGDGPSLVVRTAVPPFYRVEK